MGDESRYALLPAYLVIDTSASMNEDDAFDAAFDFLPKMLREMNKSAVVSDKLRVEVITFDETARVVFPLGTRDQLERWLEEKKSNPIYPDGNWTKYGEAFQKLREEIEQGVQQIRSESYEGEYFRSYRPVVFFITDGFPNDDDSSRASAFASLTDPGFKARPNIVCVGVGRATLADLVDYGAGKYKSPTGSYTTSNSNLVLVAKDGVAPGAALGAVIPALLQSLVSSAVNAAASGGSDDDDDLEDVFSVDDDLFDDEDFDALFDTD